MPNHTGRAPRTERSCPVCDAQLSRHARGPWRMHPIAKVALLLTLPFVFAAWALLARFEWFRGLSTRGISLAMAVGVTPGVVLFKTLGRVRTVRCSSCGWSITERSEA